MEVYKEARVLRRRVWRLTSLLPAEERYILFPQMRRAALSVTNCIAEGHGSWGYRHNVSYLRRSRGSVNELLDDINTCEDEGYFKKEHLDDLREQTQAVGRLINGYIAYLNRQAEQLDGQRGRGQAPPARPGTS